MIGIVPYLFNSFEYKFLVADMLIRHMSAMKDLRENWLIPQRINLLVRPILHIVYAAGCLVMILRFHQRRKYHRNRLVCKTRFVCLRLLSITVLSCSSVSISSLL